MMQPSNWMGFVLVVVGLVIAAAAASSLFRRDRARLGPTTRRLCRGLRLSHADRRLLQRVAGPGAGAAAMLLSRGCFDHEVARYGANAAETRRLDALRRRVFE